MQKCVARYGHILAACAFLIVSGCGEISTEPTGVDPASVAVSAASSDVDLAVPVQLTATVVPADAPQTVAWSSSDQDMATVTSTGLVTPLLAGTVTITATSAIDATVFGSIDLTAVCPAPRRVSENPIDGVEWENWVADPDCYDYVVEVDIHMNANTLVIQPGTVVGFEDGLHVRIRGTAEILADGTEELPIVLTGIEKERDAWEGVGIESRGPTHVLAWTTVEYASGAVPLSESRPAGLKIGNEVSVRLEHGMLRESAGFGLWIGYLADVTGEGANTMTANTLGPAYTYGSEVEHVLAGQSSITGNDVDEVVVRPNSIENAADWPFGTFRIEDPAGQNFNVFGSLALGPGVMMRFEGAGETLRAVSGGALSAVGTQADPIVLTGTSQVPGHWGGVQYIGTDNGNNRLEHVIVEYGGGLEGKTNRANLMVEADGGVDSRVTVVNSTFRHSEEYGVYIEAGTTLTSFSSNSLMLNGLGPLSIDGPIVRYIEADNQIFGSQITVHAGVALDESATWLDFGLPYYIKRFNSTKWEIRAFLTIEPGVVLQMDPLMNLSFEQGGGLSATGTPMNEIVFEAHSGESWGGLTFIDAGGELDNITISDGGAGAREANMTLLTINTIDPPSSIVSLTPRVTFSGATYNISFGYGDTFTTGCISPVFIPAGDELGDHCVPS